jgi:hypothetical protein
MMGFWCFPPSNGMALYRRSWGTYYPPSVHLYQFFHPGDGGGMFLRNIGATPFTARWQNPETVIRLNLKPRDNCYTVQLCKFSYTWCTFSCGSHIFVSFTYLHIQCLGQHVRSVWSCADWPAVDSSKREHVVTRHGFRASNNNENWLTGTIHWYGIT